MGTIVRMHHISYLYLYLGTLVQCNPLPTLSSHSEACWDFTVGSCSTDSDGLMDFYPDISDGGVCELLCYTRDGCNYFRWSRSSQECKLYTQLSQDCNIFGGPTSPKIEDCFQDEKPIKDFLLREDCVYKGHVPGWYDGVHSPEQCQRLLDDMPAVYSSYNKTAGETFWAEKSCTMYNSMEMDCETIGGPKPGPEIS